MPSGSDFTNEESLVFEMQSLDGNCSQALLIV